MSKDSQTTHDWDIIEKSIDSWEAFEAIGRLRTKPNDKELRERIALCLRVLFPNEVEDTYVRAAVCLIHEFNRKVPAEEKVSS